MSITFFNDHRIGPRWHGFAPLIENLPEAEKKETIDRFCKLYPPYFFELKTELDGKPTVLDQYQIKYLLDDSRFKVTSKTRQAGGSLMVAMAKFFKAYRKPGYRVDIVSVNRAEAQDKIKYVRNLYLSLPIRWKQAELSKDNTESIGFHKGANASVINSVAASTGIRGGKKDVFFDEMAFIDNADTLYTAALPALATDKTLQFEAVSTPNGQLGKYYEIWSNHENLYGEFARHKFGWWDVSRFTTDTEKARHTWENEYSENPDMLYKLLEDYGQDHFKKLVSSFTDEEYFQEFCATFLDEAGSYFTYQLIDHCRKFSRLEDRGTTDKVHGPWLEQWTKRPDGNDNEFFVGIDFAEGRKGGDSTSVQVFEKGTDGIFRLRFHEDLDWRNKYTGFDKQLNRIAEVIRNFKPNRCRVDETGLGRKLAPDLAEKVGDVVKVEPITFTNQLKEQMVTNIKKLMETGKIEFPFEYKELRGQFHNMKRVVTAHGNIQYEGSPHDDIFWACSLAVKDGARGGFRIITI